MHNLQLSNNILCLGADWTSVSQCNPRQQQLRRYLANSRPLLKNAAQPTDVSGRWNLLTLISVNPPYCLILLHRSGWLWRRWAKSSGGFLWVKGMGGWAEQTTSKQSFQAGDAAATDWDNHVELWCLICRQPVTALQSKSFAKTQSITLCTETPFSPHIWMKAQKLFPVKPRWKSGSVSEIEDERQSSCCCVFTTCSSHQQKVTKWFQSFIEDIYWCSTLLPCLKPRALYSHSTIHTLMAAPLQDTGTDL